MTRVLIVDDEPQLVRTLRAATAAKPDVVVLDIGLPDDYATKPFGMDELLARLCAAVRRANTAGRTR